MKTLALFLILCFGSLALADDFKTIDGKDYKNVKMKRVEPDCIVLSSKSEISKVYFLELPKEVQERFHYDPQKAREYSAQQARGEEEGKTKGSKADESKESQTEGARVTQGGEELKVKILQVLPDGILAYGSVAKGQRFPGSQSSGQPAPSGSHHTVYGGEKTIFFQGFRDGVAEGEVFQVRAYADGTYTYRDTSGTSRTLEKWVFTKLIQCLE